MIITSSKTKMFVFIFSVRSLLSLPFSEHLFVSYNKYHLVHLHIYIYICWLDGVGAVGRRRIDAHTLNTSFSWYASANNLMPECERNDQSVKQKNRPNESIEELKRNTEKTMI